MKNLFLIDGASGTGKSDLLRHVTNYNINAVYVQKYTTRKERAYEKKDKTWKLDLDFVSDEEFAAQNLDYRYAYAGFKYGFSRPELDRALLQSPNVFAIVRNAEIIRRVQEDYKFINVVPVFIYSNPEKIQERLARQGFDEEQQRFRLARIDIAFQDYLRHPNIYREILINNASEEDYYRLIDRLLEKYRSAPDVDEKKVFVMMSFNPDNPCLEDYYRAIKRAVVRCDPTLICISLHDITGSFGISLTAKENIGNCRLAIVDLTENKPNVYYELGYVHGISKSCIITAHKSTPAHFYPREYKIVDYKNASELEEKLVRELHGVLGDICLQC